MCISTFTYFLHQLNLVITITRIKMTTQFGELRKKATTKTKKSPEPLSILRADESHNDDELMMLKKNNFNPSTPVIDSPSLRLGKQLINRSMRLRSKESRKQVSYKKNNNLNLSDYLRLYSMSKKSQSKDKKLSEHKNKSQKDLANNKKIGNIIDAANSIEVVRQQTKKQIENAGKKLQSFLQSLNQTQHLKFDEQSLVFMCNVLHIFQDKIVQSSKYAKQLMQERKKQKRIQQFKDYSKASSPIVRRLIKSRDKTINTSSNSKVSIEHKDSVNFKTVGRPARRQ